jgi:hypothetical protein
MGSPAKTLGTFVSKRPLIAGCMLTSDANYDVIADVHVPAYCATPADFHVGCLLPAASNFDPSAKQSGVCKFKSSGCTDPAAVNYNSYATDSDGSCILRVPGCTVKSATYSDVDATTPEYKSLEAADSVRWIGVRKEGTVRTDTNTEWYTSQTVINYDSNANVLSGCVVAIEGCMDKDAVNYNPAATTNTGTWCVPKLTGCMLPAYNGANQGWVDVANQREGLAIRFEGEATIHSKQACLDNVAHYGCQDNTALNFDPAATAPGRYPCYYFVSGCLNPAALNFGCEQKQNDQNGCSLDNPRTRVTGHDPNKCTWRNGQLVGQPEPPAPPPPQLPPGDFKTEEEIAVASSFVIAQPPDALLSTKVNEPVGCGSADNPCKSAADKLLEAYTATAFTNVLCSNVKGDACNGIGAACQVVREYNSNFCAPGTRRALRSAVSFGNA